MRWVGRAIALLFLLWFVALVLGGFGVAPSGGWRLGRALGPHSHSAPRARVPAPRPSAVADFASALPQAAASVPVVQRSSVAAPQAKPRARGRSAVAPGHTKTTLATPTPTPGKGHAYGHKFAKRH